MQIPELLFLFDTMRLAGEIPVQSDGVLQKAGFNFFKGGLKGEFGNESPLFLSETFYDSFS